MVLTASLLLVAAGCSADDPGKEVRGTTSLVPPDPATIPTTVSSVNAFGIDLYRTYRDQHRGNFVLAPYVIAYGLGMARAGADGPTLQQMDRVLRVASGQDLDRGFATLAQLLSARTGDRRSDTRKGKVEIVAASSLWAPRGTKFKESFLDTLSSFYGTGVRVVDFRSDPETARAAMNNWARDATRGNVTQLAPRGLLTDQTRLIDASTSTLQAPWLQPFLTEQTAPARFTTDDGQVTTPRTMSASIPAGARLASGPAWQALELSYLGEQLSMVLILPDAGTFDSFEKALSAEQLLAIVGALKPQPVDVHLPKFQFETDARLDSELRAMGMPAALSDTEADFSGMADNENLELSAVQHQSYVDVSENGTGTQTGSITVTQGAGNAGPDTIRVTLDRPFLVLIRDKETGLLLSLGRVVNPSG